MPKKKPTAKNISDLARSKPKEITTSRVRFLRRHKAFMPNDECNFPGGVAKTLVQIGVAEFVSRRGVWCNPDGSPITPSAKAKRDAKTTDQD